jgi:hypothetical protein
MKRAYRTTTMVRSQLSLRAFARIVVAVLVEAGAVVSLTTIGARCAELRVPLGHLGPWLRHRDSATVAVALIRGAGLVVAGWLLVSTLLYLAASACRAPAFVRAVGWTTLPAVRRALDATVAVSIATSVVLSPATADARPNDPTDVSLVRDGHGGAIAQLPADTATPSPTTAPPTIASPGGSTTAAAPPVPAPPNAAAPDEVVVRAGDNLWLLAAVHLAERTDRSPVDITDAEIAPYWARVCETNRYRLRSRDPNLVYPGERVVLPPVG